MVCVGDIVILYHPDGPEAEVLEVGAEKVRVRIPDDPFPPRWVDRAEVLPFVEKSLPALIEKIKRDTL